MIGALLAKNPLASGLGIVAVLAIAGAGVQSLRLAWSQEEVAEGRVAFADYKRDAAEKALAEERKAKAKSDDKVAELVNETRAIGAIAQQAKTEVRFVQSNGGPCTADPAWIAGMRGVQSILDAGKAAAGGAGKTGR